jgi:hypothetical protein
MSLSEVCSNGSVHGEQYLLRFDAVQLGSSLLTLQDLLPPSSGIAACLALSSTLMEESVRSSRKSVNVYQTTRRHYSFTFKLFSDRPRAACVFEII